MPSTLPAWALQMAWIREGDENLPSELHGVNIVLNRMRLATFLARFGEDRDVRDLLTIDVMASSLGLPLTSTGLPEYFPELAIRPFRIWEYVWLYKALRLYAGGQNVLDLGGSASHLSILSAATGCQVTSIDLNPEFVRAAEECARALNLSSLSAQVGDMRDLSRFKDASFDAVISCSVLEHLTGEDQKIAMGEMARVLKPQGLIGLTFDFGLAAPGANEYLPPPHDPAPSWREALRRYLQGGLVPAGNQPAEDPIPGSLFHHDAIRYTVASLFLAKDPAVMVDVPQPNQNGSVLHGLRIPQLPYRLYEQVNRGTALFDSLRQKDENIAQLRLELEVRDRALSSLKSELERVIDAVNQQHGRAVSLEEAASERLAAMHEKDLLIVKLSAQLREAAGAANQDRQRAAGLERAAAERLAAMRDKDLLIVKLTAELQDAIDAVNQQHRRAAVLEQAAEERLAEMHRKDEAIQKLAAGLDARDAALADARKQLVQTSTQMESQHEPQPN